MYVITKFKVRGYGGWQGGFTAILFRSTKLLPSDSMCWVTWLQGVGAEFRFFRLQALLYTLLTPYLSITQWYISQGHSVVGDSMGRRRLQPLNAVKIFRCTFWQFTCHHTPENCAMVTCERLRYWAIILLCKVCRLSIQCPLPALTDPGQVQIWLHTSQLNKLSLIIASLFWSFHFFRFFHFFPILGTFLCVLFFRVKEIWKSL